MRAFIDQYLFSRPGNFCANRLFEWVMTVAVLGLGLQLLTQPELLLWSSFRILSALTNEPKLVGAVFLLAALLRVSALIANGRWIIWGPRVRALGAIFGALIWFQFALVAPAFSVPLVLMLGECLTMYRAATDVRVDFL